MRLVSFSLRRYRSISEAERIPIHDLTILIGPNNEGKSNILRALDLSIELLRTSERFSGGGRIPLFLARNYEWERDFPVGLRDKERGSKESSFTLEFHLTEEEVREFREAVGSQLNGTLPVQISLGQSSGSLRISKQGRGGKALNQRLGGVLAFINRRLAYNYIPAVRTAQTSLRIVERILSEELQPIQEDIQYQDALQAISRLQEPVLRHVSESIQTTLKEFLPGLATANVHIQEEERHEALRHATVLIDDGAETDLRQKGDGIQSLAAIAMMRFASQRRAGGRHIVLAIEEPESHLHPAAIQQVRRILAEISKTSQVVVSTHSPELVDRASVRSHVIVSSKRARSAKAIREVRDALGVRLAHNLQNADLMLAVEGATDEVMLRALIAVESARLQKAIQEGFIAFTPLDGAPNLSNMARIMNGLVLPLHCLLDDDEAGREALDQAWRSGLIGERDVNFTACPGQREAELEDLIQVRLYRDAVQERFGITLDHPEFHTARKWNVRMRGTFRGQGRAWNETVKLTLKGIVAESVVDAPEVALSPDRRDAIDCLFRALIGRLADLRV